MANEFKVKNGLIVIGDLTTSGTITINGALAATQSWVTSQAYLTSASLSGYATQSYVTSAIAALVDSAPAALDTLNELAAALGDDANFSTTITTAIGNKVSKSGDTMTGLLTAPKLSLTATGNDYYLNLNGLTMTSISTGETIWRNLSSFRFSDVNDWDYSSWAGLKFINSTKQIVLGVAGNVFTANSPQTGTLLLDRISTVYVNNTSQTVWHSGNLTNLNQLTNGPGYITSYTETDTLATVTGRGATTSTNISVNNVKIGTDGTYGGGYSTIGFGGTTNGYNRVFGNNGTSDGLFLASATGVGIYFRTNGGSTDHMVITSAGNVGIGTTTPYGKLDVYTGGSGSWTRFVVTTTDLWGDSGTQYVTIGAGGAAGIMIHNPHIVWDGAKAAIRLGRSGGVSGGAWYQVGTMAGDEFMIAKNGEWGNGGIKINSSGVLYYGSTGYRYIWENGTWGINITGNANYANTAGSTSYATTAGALTSMNISQFTNNSGYVAYGNYSWTSPVFGQYGIKSNLIDNVLYSAADRFEVFKDGVAWNTNCVFNLNYDQNCDVIPTSTSRTYSIVLNTKGNSSSGITYTEGNVYLSFYYVYIPASVSGRVRFQNGTWVNMSGWTNVANSGSYAVWRGNVPGGNYMVEIEITINASASINTWFAQWEYVMGRPGQYELGIINKAQDNSLWRNMYFRDSSNNVQVSIGASGLSTSQNLHISGTSALYFPSYGGGFYMQDSSWIRTVNYKSIWTQTGLLGTDGGLTVGYGGATPPTGGAIIAGTVGIGTSSPSYKLDVNGTGRYAGVLTVDTDILTRTKLQISNGRLFELIGSSTALNIYDSSAGASRLYITDGGNIGVGTTNPGTKLHVVGNAWINRPSNKVDNAGATELGPRVEFNNSFASGQSGYVIFRYPTYNNFLISSDYDGNVGGAIPNIQFGKQSTVYLHMNSSNGNIGIGTTSPSYKLHVVGDLYVSGTNGAFTTDNSQSNLYFLSLTRSTTSLVTAGNVGIKVANPTATLSLGTSSYDNNPLAGLEYSQVTGGGRLDLKVQTWGTGSNYGLTTGLSVLTPGFDTADVRVGIGTTSPATPLHVTGGATGTGGWNRTATLAATYPGLIFNSNGTKWGGMAYDYSAAMRFWVNANNDDIFAGTQAMSILNNGNVGIGTSNPIYKLQVAGSAYVNGGTLFIDSGEYLRWGNSNQGIVGVNDSHVAIVSGGATRQTIYAEGRTYFPGLDLSISNVNGSHGSGTYFRGDGGHFVFGLSSGNTLYLNYGNSAGILRTFGTWYHESTQILSTSRVLTNVSGNISMFTNDAGYLTSVSDIWVNTAGDTMTGSLLFADVADNVRLQKGSSFLNLRDPWNNTHLSNGAGGGHYFDASHFYLRTTGGGTTWLYLDGSNLNVSVEQNNYSRVYFRYNADRYSQTWYNSTTGAYWWVTTDADKLGFHRNGDGDKFYFSNAGDFYSTTNGWLSTALAAKQNASTAITTSNIASQSVSYANSAGEAGQVTNQSGQLLRYDNRTISPSETTAGYLQFGFTSWGNDNSSPYADYLHMRSYTDGSGGNDNLVMFLKSGIGMRIYQQTFGSGSAYSSYADVWHTGNLTNLNQLTNGPGYITGYTETDTLASVTNRGNSTTDRINVRGAGNQGGGNIMMGNTGEGTSKWSYLTSTHYNASSQPQGFALIGGLATSGGNAVIIGGNIYETNPATEIQFWTHGTNTHNLGGTQRGVINSAGNWGIGTSTPSKLLEVAGDIMAGTSNKIGFRYSGGDSNFYNYITADNANPLTLVGGMWTATGATEGIRFATYNGAALSILNNGNVGIGTTSPSAKLEIAGFSTGAGLKLNYGNSSGTIEAVNFIANGGANGVIGMQMVSAGVGDLWLGGSGGRTLTLYRDGNVGIGVTTPQKKLDVFGSAGIVASIGASIGVGQFAGLHFGYSESYVNNDSYKKSALVFERTESHGQGSNASGKIHFLLNNISGTSANALTDSVVTIDSDASATVGSVRMGIGTRNPSYPLDVNGTSRFSQLAYYDAYESMNFYGARGRFTNEYIHLYNKVGVGHPGGWGQGETSTPVYGLSTYGGINIGYGYDGSAVINTYTRINYNWGGGTYGTEAFTIRGTYPSLTLRSTNADNKWLFHNDGSGDLRFYQGSGVDTNTWTNYITFNRSGQIDAIGGNSSQWNTAYSWGNHASASYATTSYVTTQINNLINGAPGVLDTLDELAAALGDDSNFATTVTNSIAGKVSKAGDTMTGNINWDTQNTGLTWNMNTDGAYIKFFNTGDGDTNSRLEYSTSDNGDEYHRWVIAGVEKMNLKWGGLTVTDTIYASGGNSGNWNTAYGWGNHASAGYALNSSLANYLPLSGGVIGGGVTINGNLTVNGTITENSSIKLKENIETSEGNLEKVVNLRPVTYNKIGSQTTELGLIAEEVAEVYPEFVQYDENGEPIGVHYSRLTAALIGAVKELNEQLQELKRNK